MQELVFRLTPYLDDVMMGEDYDGVSLCDSSILFRIARAHIPPGHIVEVCSVSEFFSDYLVATVIDVTGMEPKKVHTEKINSKDDKSILALMLLLYFKK